MSDKLISANDLAQGVKNWGKIKGREGASDVFLYAINNAPAVDAVVAVRCGECIHMMRISNACYCKVWGGYNGHGINGFCSSGERREDNEID